MWFILIGRDFYSNKPYNAVVEMLYQSSRNLFSYFRKAMLLSILACFCAGSLSSQVIHRLRAEGQYGFIIPHASDLRYVSGSVPTGVTLTWQRMNSSQSSWDVCNCFHYLGFQFSYHNFGNPDVLGAAYSLAAGFEPVILRGQAFSVTLHSGIGVSYLTRVHHPDTNPLNLFFSSPVSFLLFVAPALEYRFSGNWGGRISLNYNHISNGGQKQPNRGINFPQVGVGVNYYFQTIRDLPEYSGDLPERNMHYWLESGITSHKVEDESRRKPSISFAGGVYKPVSVLNAFGTGLEFTYDMSQSNQRGGSGLLAPFVSHHFLLGRFDFNQRMCYSILKQDLPDSRFYQRYTILYNLLQKYRIGFSMKAHGHVASGMDFRLGYRF
jgi:hypothetical protein